MTENPRPDVIIIPCFNRRDLTLACLQSLAADGVLEWAVVLVVDDGSSDRTSESVRQIFPSVELLRGDGNWWWSGAIRQGMEWALDRGAERVFWLNDDCRPPPDGLKRLRDLVAREQCVAWIDARAPGGWSYGGHRRTLSRLRRCTPAEEQSGQIDSFSGNCVCLPRSWIERVGPLHNQLFPHGLGDLDYGLRLREAGATLCPLPRVTAENANPAASSSESWLLSLRPMSEIWGDFSSPKSFLYFPAWRRFALRHWGPIWGWVVFSLPYGRWAVIAAVRMLAPGLGRWWARRALNLPNGRETS